MASKSKKNSFTKVLFSADQDDVTAVNCGKSSTEPCTASSNDSSGRSCPYDGLYRALDFLREEFHRIGKFDDANAKLDELCKLLVLKVLDSRHPLNTGTSRLNRIYLEEIARKHTGTPGHIAFALHHVFDELVTRFSDEMSFFGPRPSLNIREDDDEFALALVPLLQELPDERAAKSGRWQFDSLNELFGHFIQDSFRNRKEDAQYMTPPEVVSAVVDVAIHDLLSEIETTAKTRRILVVDPTCGVGSFLAAFYRHACHIKVGNKPLASRIDLFGQDKVERMVRLAAVNLKIFADTNSTLRQGNSIVPVSCLEDIAGKVDLILTNPPFGATFASEQVFDASAPEDYPILFSLKRSRLLPKTVDSEYLLLDREIALLKPGGRLFIVVPDHVVSAGGFSEDFRHALSTYADLLGVFDLPTETFAQAGTRTKTSVVYLQRKNTSARTCPRHVFMAVSENLGFRVVARNGVSVKRIVGKSDLEQIIRSYYQFSKMENLADDIVLLNDHPSVAAVDREKVLNSRWTAGFYKTERLAALQCLSQLDKSEFEVERLVDVVQVNPDGTERVLPDVQNRCISVLHIGEDGCIDLRAVDGYRPTTSCVRCKEGDVLFSKINPRIVRIAVVPPTPWQLGCSSEFAVLRTKTEELSPWALCLLLRSDVVQAQIQTLTTGTSSSHNRIKTKDLAIIKIQVPRKGTLGAHRLAELAERYQDAGLHRYEAVDIIGQCYDGVVNLLKEG